MPPTPRSAPGPASGFWGTIAIYFPELDASVAVFILERDQSDLRDELIKRIFSAIYAGSKTGL